MSVSQYKRTQIYELQEVFIPLKKEKQSLFTLIDEAELSESVYNSNAIENSTLTLKETERILLILIFPVRLVFEKSSRQKISHG